MIVKPLAVATQDPSSLAETYVREHIRTIMPGGTVAIALAGQAKSTLDVPLLRLEPPARTLLGRVARLDAYLRGGYGAALTRSQERKLLDFLATHGTEAILAEFGPTGAALRPSVKRAGLRLFVNFHGHDATVLPKRADIRRAYALLARDAEGFVCGSEHFKGILIGLGFPEERIAVIPCGIVADTFGASPERDPHLVLGIGRMTEKKRPDLTIRAFAQAHAEVPSLRLELVGGGARLADCASLVRRLGIEEAVILHGPREHAFVRERLARAGIFVQHSMTAANGDQESQGISLIEAMAAGLPVVTTDHNGFRETVLDGQTGLLGAEGDVEAMARSIVRLARDEGLRRDLGRAGRERARTMFDVDAMAAKLRALIFPRAKFSRQVLGRMPTLATVPAAPIEVAP